MKTYYKITPEGDSNYCVVTLENLASTLQSWLSGAGEEFGLLVEEIKMTENKVNLEVILLC